MSRYDWFETAGGPAALIPSEKIAGWRGIEGWEGNTPEDQSDYARACRVRDWIGKVTSSNEVDVVILSGDVRSVAWFPNERGVGGTIVRWIYSDSEDLIDLILRERPAPSEPARPENSLDFDTGPSGEMYLFDSAEPGLSPIFECLKLELQPGRYHLIASYVETPKCAVVLMDIVPVRSDDPRTNGRADRI